MIKWIKDFFARFWGPEEEEEYHLHLSIPKDSWENFQDLRARSGCKTEAELVRTALNAYHVLVEESANRRVNIQQKSGEIVQLVLLPEMDN